MLVGSFVPYQTSELSALKNIFVVKKEMLNSESSHIRRNNSINQEENHVKKNFLHATYNDAYTSMIKYL